MREDVRAVLRDICGVHDDHVFGLADPRERALEDLAIRIEREELARFVRGHPADFVVLVIVRGGVASSRLHQEKVHELVHALPWRSEPVVGRSEVAEDANFQTRLLFDLSERGVLNLLAPVRGALWKDPGAIGMSTRENDLARAVSAAKDDATCGDRIADARRPAGTDRRHVRILPDREETKSS